MKIDFLYRSDSSKLVLVFSGWNTGAEFYSDVRSDGWDVAVVTGYETIDRIEIPARYTTVYLYAWSFGVKVAEVSVDPSRITEAYAIAGTSWGIDETKGIPPAVFQATLDSLSPRSLVKFRRRMLDGASEASVREKVMARLDPDPNIEVLRRELISIASVIPREALRWRRAYVPDHDMVIPTDAQRRAWEGSPHRPEIQCLHSSHFVSVADVVGQTITDIKTVGRRFQDSHHSYTENAGPQEHFARRLASRLEAVLPVAWQGCMLEIGSGSGMLTRMVSAICSPAAAAFIDLYPLPRFGLFPQEEYIEADAERWIAETDRKFDLILSASAIQWFSNVPLFFSHAARSLSPGGTLGCTFFTAGTLGELDAVRPAPLNYHTDRDVRLMLEPWFDEIDVTESAYVSHFPSAREALLHLARTGVNAGPKVALPKLLAALRDKHLTYRAVTVTANKKQF